MRSAGVTGAGAGLGGLALQMALAACGTSQLQPIRDPPSLDGAAGATTAAHATGPADAALDDAPVIVESTRCKRGMAANDGPTTAFAPSASTTGLSWWYNWAAESPGGDASIEYVPMIWGGGSLAQTVPTGARYLLGFNEPDFKSQSNLTPQQAASYWPSVVAKAKAAGIPVVSPGVNFCGSGSDTSQCSDPTVTDPYTYLKDFFAACPGCEVDSIAVHAYECDLPSLRGYIDGNEDAGGTLQGFAQFDKPIWITELACDASHSVADQKAYMQAAVPYLEADPNVFRYAWFNADPIPNAELTNADGSLTDLGTTYVGLPQTCP